MRPFGKRHCDVQCLFFFFHSFKPSTVFNCLSFGYWAFKKTTPMRGQEWVIRMELDGSNHLWQVGHHLFFPAWPVMRGIFAPEVGWNLNSLLIEQIRQAAQIARCLFFPGP